MIEKPPDRHPLNWRSRLMARRWELLIMGVLGLLGLYGILFTPSLTSLINRQAISHGVDTSRPFYYLYPLRAYLTRNYAGLAWFIALLGGGLSLLLGRLGKSAQARNFGLISGALTVAALGQWALNAQPSKTGWGILLYAIAIFGCVLWAWRSQARLADNWHDTGSRRQALVLFVGVMALTAATRLYAAPGFPYGVEGDEKDWTVEVVSLMDGVSTPSGDYHFGGVPISFYMQMPFQRLFGPGIAASRYTVIFYSLLGSACFFWFLRQSAPLPLAALTAFLLSISIADISASRIANVESHVKFAPLLTLALLAWARQKGRWQLYFLCGLALTLGALTYDTVLPMVGVVGGLMVVDLYRDAKTMPAHWTHRLSPFIAAAVPVLFGALILIPYIFSRLGYYQVAGDGWFIRLVFSLERNVGNAFKSWFVSTNSDFIYSRPNGPMLNAALMPWVVFGVVIACFSWNQFYARCMLLWAGLLVIPIPLLTGSSFARVYYPALPAVYGLAGLSLFTFFKELDRWLGPKMRLAWGLLLGLALLGMMALNVYSYFNEVSDDVNRRVRRELGDFILAGTTSNAHWLLPYIFGAQDPLLTETLMHTVNLYLRSALSPDQVSHAYDLVTYAELLPQALAHLNAGRTVEMLLDLSSLAGQAQRKAVAATLLRCFPQAQHWSGVYFDRYRLTPDTLVTSTCAPVALQLLAAPSSLDHGLTLTWSLSSQTTTALQAHCQRYRADVVWVEAEDFADLGNWRPDITLAANWSGTSFLFDENYSQALAQSIRLPANPLVYVWVRYYKRRSDASPGWVTVMDQSNAFADVQDERGFNQWRWERVGPFDVTVSDNVWRINRRPAREDPERWALFLDAAVFTTDAQFSPETDSRWDNWQQKDISLATPAATGIVDWTLNAAGTYQCQATLNAAAPSIVDGLGNPFVRSNGVDVSVP